MDYFKSLPRINYDFTTTEELKQIFGLSDVTTRVQTFYDEETANNMFDDYYIREWDTPEKISYALYGTTDYYWTVMYINNLYDMFSDWPLTSIELDVFADRVFTGTTYSPYPNDLIPVEVKFFNSGSFTIHLPKSGTLSQPIFPNLLNVGMYVPKIITGVDDTEYAKIVSITEDANEYLITLDHSTIVYPKPAEENIFVYFTEAIEKKNDIAYFMTPNGAVIDYDPLSTDKVYGVTNFQTLEIKNESKRYIKVVKKDYIAAFASLYFNRVIV